MLRCGGAEREVTASMKTQAVYRLKTFRVAQVAETAPAPYSDHIRNAERAAALLRVIFAELDADREHLVALALDTRQKPIGYKAVASGGMAAAPVDARVLFRAALLLGAARIIIAHNHPSGNCEPSPEDRALTRRLVDAGKVLDCCVLDHIIIGGEGSHYSFLAHGEMP